MFNIDTNIPMPTSTFRPREKGDFAKTLAALDVGASFFAPNRTPKGTYAAVSPTKNGGKSFQVRAANEGGVDGVRVWRKA